MNFNSTSVIKSTYRSNLNSTKNQTTSCNIKNIKKFNIHVSDRLKHNTVVNYQQFPQNFPIVHKNMYKNIKLKEIFHMVKLYKPEFKH